MRRILLPLAAALALGEGVADAPIAKHQAELLDLAFTAASAMPLQPHVKNRSRAQEAVVEACFALDQPRRALADVERIDNWRRGLGYADFALYCVKHAEPGEAQRYLDLAADVSKKEMQDEDAQEWRVERIRVRIAQAYLAMGQAEKAAPFAQGVPASELGDLAIDHARRADPATIDAQLAAVDQVAAVGDFDQLRNVLQACAELYDRFYDDAARRAAIEAKVKSAWKKLPSTIRLELLATLADAALRHGDAAQALRLVDESAALLQEAKLTPGYRIPWMARLAALRFRAGDADKARGEAAEAMKAFDAERVAIVNIERADVLRPVAEAFQAMGDRVGAVRAFTMAVEAGVENPNSRPRAEDLSATCCSMARCAFEPDDALRARLLEIASKLGDPW